MKIYCYNYKKFYVSFTVTTKQKSTVDTQKINEKKKPKYPITVNINSKMEWAREEERNKGTIK